MSSINTMEALYTSLLSVFLIVQGVYAGSCPDFLSEVKNSNTAVHNHVCYLFVNKEVYWSIARDKCWNLGGEMLAIENQATMDFIKDKLNSPELRWDREGVWLGGRYKYAQWRWTNGRKMNYTNWASGEPSKLLGFLSVEDCAQMRKDDGWKWHDYPCGAMKFHYNYVCQFQAIDTSTTTTTTPASSLPSMSFNLLSKKSPDLSKEEYARLGKHVYHMINGHQLPNSYHILHSNLNNAALNKPGDSAGRVASSASNQEEDNGNTSILAIIIGLSAGLLLLLFIIFLLLHFHHRRTKQKAEASVHYSNGAYNTPARPTVPEGQLPPVPCSRPPQTGDDLYLTPKDVTGMYAEVSKPSSHLHTVSFPSRACGCTHVQTGASNSVGSSPGTSSELGACGSSDPEQELKAPLMTGSNKSHVATATANANPAPPPCNCSHSHSQGEYIDMNSLVMKENGKCVPEEEKHTYTNVDHRDTGNENHYEVLP